MCKLDTDSRQDKNNVDPTQHRAPMHAHALVTAAFTSMRSGCLGQHLLACRRVASILGSRTMVASTELRA
jgi:hypothetical protein